MRVLLLLVLVAGCAAPASPAPGTPPEAVWGPPGSPVHPGVRIGTEAPAGVPTGRTGGCTAAFLFLDGAAAYVGTAAHCLGEAREIDLAGAASGTVVYCSFATRGRPCATDPTRGERNDFGILRLRDEDRGLAHPSLGPVVAPLGLAACDEAKAGARVVAYGNSTLRPDRDEAKILAGEVVARDDAFTLVVRFTPPTVPADSGSPVVTADRLALGVVRALQTDGTTHVVCLDAALDAMREEGGPDVTVAVAQDSGLDRIRTGGNKIKSLAP